MPKPEKGRDDPHTGWPRCSHFAFPDGTGQCSRWADHPGRHVLDADAETRKMEADAACAEHGVTACNECQGN